jgi:hypothetical protein
MSRGDNSISYKETRPVAEGLFNMLDSGTLLTTIIGCTTKYCRSFRAVVNTLYKYVPRYVPNCVQKFIVSQSYRPR